MTDTPTPRDSSLVLRLLAGLTFCLALGDLVWFIGTFPSYFRWFSQGWMSPGIPLFLLWAFIGLPSLACATLTVRLARAAGRLGFFTRMTFLLILAICMLVPLLGSFAAWSAGRPSFPWLLWLVTLALGACLWAYALRFRVRPGA